MTKDQEGIVYALLVGWWLGCVYPNAGFAAIALLGVGLIVANAFRRVDRSHSPNSTKEKS